LQMLDAIRYMVVYNPILFLIFSLFAHLAPHHTIHRHIAVATGLAASPAAAASGVAGMPPAVAAAAAHGL
ncbi:hypothetical protein MNEG_13814, partial [Monoraphidium neglectum]